MRNAKLDRCKMKTKRPTTTSVFELEVARERSVPEALVRAERALEGGLLPALEEDVALQVPPVPVRFPTRVATHRRFLHVAVVALHSIPIHPDCNRYKQTICVSTSPRSRKHSNKNIYT